MEIIKVEEIEGLYETKTLDVLEFDKIKSFVASETISDLGREKVSKMSPATDFETVEFQMNETDEISQIYNKHRLPSLSGLAKISPLIHRANIGGVLNVTELNLVKRLIQVQNQFKTFYNQLLEEDEQVVKYPILNDKMNQLPILSDLFQEINENVIHTIYMIAQVMNCKVYEVKFQVQTNAYDKI